MALNQQQELFVKHYLSGSSAEVAASLAGYSEKHARGIGNRLLRHRDIAARLEAKKVEVLEPVNEAEPISNADWLIVRLESIADFNIKKVANVVDGEVTFKPLNEWSDQDVRAIDSIKQTISVKPDGTRVTTTEYKICDKLKAMDMLGRYHGIWSGFDQLVMGLKAYGIELVRDGDKFMVKQSD